MVRRAGAGSGGREKDEASGRGRRRRRVQRESLRPAALGAAAGTTINTMPPITSDGLHELIDEMFPEVADVWSFLTEDDDDLVVEWARYNNK